MKLAASYSQMLNAGLAIVTKKRLSATAVESGFLVGEVKDKDVLLVDDITETAGTITAAARLLKKEGAKRIFAGISHALLGELAVSRLKGSDIDELITTNSTPVQPIEGFNMKVLSVAEILGEAIHRIHSGESVSSLFNIDGKKSF